ncbi:MAG: hypothetical protein ACM3SV_00605 [Betaproteobacteria bacterium]
MDVSLSIPGARFSDLTSVTPVSSRVLAAVAPAASTPGVDSGSSVVELSGAGVVLAATFGFESDLQALQADASGTTPDSVINRAQGLVTAFNTLQQNLASAPSGLAAAGETTTAGNLSQTLNALVTTTITGDVSAPRGLGSIGITLQAAAADGTTGVALSIDRQVLVDAVAADTPGTSALLDQTIQSLIDRTAAFESQAANAVAAEAGASAALTSTANTDLAQARNITNPLAAVANAATAPNTGAAQVLPATAAANNAGADNAPTATTTPIDVPAVLPVPTLVATPTAPAAPTATSANAADREAFAARLALQTALDNPTRRSLDIVFDPAYSALMAATHPSDFIMAAPTFAPQGVPDTIQPIVPVRALDRIAAYGDVGGEARRRINTVA